MPDRMIRNEILTSERYWSVSDQAKLLYVHLLLSADDTARFSGKNFTLRTACFPGRGIEPEAMESMLMELERVDLIRPYQVDNERFIFIPRFRQRLRYTNSKYPAPPKEINDLEVEKSDSSPSQDWPKSAEVKRSKEKTIVSAGAARVPEGFVRFWQTWPQTARKAGKAKALSIWKARRLEAIADQIIAHVVAMKATRQWQDGYEPAPLTYINQSRWEDGVPAGAADSAQRSGAGAFV